MRHFKPTSQTMASLLDLLSDVPWPSVNAAAPSELLKRCSEAGETPLRASPDLAALASVGQVFVKDERARMGLGSFKALGAAYVIASDAEAGHARGRTYVTASAGNHGLSVAAGAQAFGAKSVIFLSDEVPEGFAERLRLIGADVRREGVSYEESMAAAAAFSEKVSGALLSDSSWPGYFERPHRLMEGYLVLMEEAVAQFPAPPTHIFLQAGVGGLAAACAAYARKAWGNAPRVIVVEPEAAPALFASAEAGAPQVTSGPASEMGRLDCKEPSLIALKGLARDASDFMLITEEEGRLGALTGAKFGLESTPSGAAGIAGLIAATSAPEKFGMTKSSQVLTILSEEPTL